MSEEKRTFKAGDQVRLTLTEEGEDAGDEPLYVADYALDNAGEANLLKEIWQSPELQAFNALPDTAPTGGSSGLDVARFAWDIIKSNRPVARGAGTMTSVLWKGTEGLDYTNARESKTRKFLLKVDDWPTGIRLITVRFRLEGTYGATPTREDVPFGHYLPSIYFNVTECSAVWPTWVEASAEVTSPSDFGSASDRVPRTRVYAKFSWGWVGSANNLTCGFVADGRRGMSASGWE